MKPKGAARAGLAVIFILVLIAAVLAALWVFLRPPAVRPLAPLALSPVKFEDVPGWKANDARGALAAFQRSCLVILDLAPGEPMGGAGYAGTAGDWQTVCRSAADAQPSAARTWFEQHFAPFRVGAADQGLFTGYYEPQIHGSRTRHGPFTQPIYGLPRDLVTADLGLFRSNLAGIRVAGRVASGRLVPFPNRAQIDVHGLADAPVLLYADDAVAVFFLHIQGSGRARLDDGQMIRLAYAGQNGRAYTPIGRTLIARGALDREHMSMQAIRVWLKAHPGAAMKMMESDQSFVFFRELPIGNSALGSPGSEGVPLTPETSIAVDPAIHAFGTPMFVATEAPAADPQAAPTPFARLAIAQDTGGAIKGAARADIFWGFGPNAEAIAGRMKSSGTLYVLLPRPLAAQVAQHSAQS